jgi:2-polyprenyl-3-methyl-5-hydroxy-6-metoxy-1,4-benzoquinol methylase
MHPVLRETKARFQPVVRDVLKTSRSPALDEAALPAYAHRNPLVDLVFWRRLNIAFAEAQRHSGRRALDFGCGVGLMSEALASGGFQVTAVDQDFGPKRLLEGRITFSKSIAFVEGDLATLDLAPGSFDVILALDVLEHVAPLAPYVNSFERLLRPDGVLIVCGPTENWLYRFGRRLAGREFTGHYHVGDIRDVAASLGERFEVRTVARVIWPATLFKVLSCRKRPF